MEIIKCESSASVDAKRMAKNKYIIKSMKFYTCMITGLIIPLYNKNK